eukprot:s6511_g1.t1
MTTRPLHYVLAIGNALCLPVLLLTLQSPAIRGLPLVGDYLDQVSWYGQKDMGIALLVCSDLSVIIGACTFLFLSGFKVL